MASTGADIISDVKEYYGKALKTKEDLKTNACVTACGPTQPHIRQVLGLIHDEVVSKYYGCGMIVPECLEGAHILDLGSGSGRDCYVLSKLVGENGHVTGVDMTDEQLDVANRHIDYHRDAFGFSKSNVRFVKGYIEKLDECGLDDSSFDIIVSNCVINLSPDKPAVLREAYRLLKTGGELYFSDVYADRDLPDDVRKHKVLWGECIAGALWWKDLIRLAGEIGFSRPRIVEANETVIEDPTLKQVLGDAKFASVTYRLFKLPSNKESASEVMYDGSVTACAKEFKLDYNHKFQAENVAKVDGEVATILKCSRFSDSFEVRPTKEGAACCSQTEDIVNPFELMQKFATTPTAGSCCGPKGCC